jgi:hypothetical protein
MIPKRFLAELKRRHVYNVAAGYIVMAWPLIQVTTQIAPLFDLPRAAVRVVVLLLIFVGFPAAVGLSWVFDLTPDGIDRTKDPRPGGCVTDRSGWELRQKHTTTSSEGLVAPD